MLASWSTLNKVLSKMRLGQWVMVLQLNARSTFLFCGAGVEHDPSSRTVPGLLTQLKASNSNPQVELLPAWDTPLTRSRDLQPASLCSFSGEIPEILKHPTRPLERLIQRKQFAKMSRNRLSDKLELFAAACLAKLFKVQQAVLQTKYDGSRGRILPAPAHFS